MPVRKVHMVALAAVLIGRLILCVASMRNDSATDDEPAHIAVGLMEARFARMGMLESEPPLLHAVAGIVLLTLHVNLPADWFTDKNPLRLCQSLIYTARNYVDTCLFNAWLPHVIV